MATLDQGIEIEVRHPIRQGDDRRPETWVPDWLTEVREMRGRIWYDSGRRPFFLQPNGSFNDADPVDLNAYHIIARSNGHAIGCSRMVPLSKGRPSILREHLGEGRTENLIRNFGIRQDRTCEASRWAVVPEHRNGLGRRIVMTTWAVASDLGFDLAFVLACTSERQDRALLRLGAKPVPGLGAIRVDDFLEDARLMYFDVLNPSEFARKQIAEISETLDLNARGAVCAVESAVA